MDIKSLTDVEKELNGVIGKFTEIQKFSIFEINNLIELTQNIIENLQGEGNPNYENNERRYVVDDPMTGEVQLNNEEQLIDTNQMQSITKILECIDQKLHGISAKHRHLHSDVSKVGKSIDRNFVSDLDSIISVNTLEDKQNVMLLHKVIAKHYNRLGITDVVESLMKESKLPVEMVNEVRNMDNRFTEIYNIGKDIEEHRMEPALVWAHRHYDLLTAKNSFLEFKLHRVAFLQLLMDKKSNQLEALNYARQNFNKYMNRFTNEITELMGCFIYLQDGIENSPYKYLVMPESWIETAYFFISEACRVLEISKNSSLSIVFNVGCKALPTLLSISQVMENRDVFRMWSNRDELPVEINLDVENRYHSVFACPILRQQSTEDNPPKKLLCGHVISNDALIKLRNGQILKCPYCPMQQNPDDCLRIYF